jgi:hypothetical protein
MNELYSYYLHYNPFTEYWCAVKRDKSVEYLNGTLKEEDVLKNKNVNNLIKYISTTKTK